MRYALVSSCAIVMACSARAEDGGDEDSGGIAISEDSEGTDETQGMEGDTDPSGCDPNECADLCAQTQDECWSNFDGVCTDDDVCVCEPPSIECLPCGSAGPLWETCYEEFSPNGECQLACGYDFEFLWDADVGCVIQLATTRPGEVDMPRVVVVDRRALQHRAVSWAQTFDVANR